MKLAACKSPPHSSCRRLVSPVRITMTLIFKAGRIRELTISLLCLLAALQDHPLCSCIRHYTRRQCLFTVWFGYRNATTVHASLHGEGE